MGIFALVLILSIGQIFAHTDTEKNATNVAIAIVAPNPISIAAAGITALCQHTQCQPADFTQGQ